MPSDAAREFANSNAAFLIAPAGCGKTELLASSVRHLPDRRQLVLTHTHAGVRAVRDRLQRLGAASRSYRVDTIAGFSLRLAASYPRLSGLANATPRAPRVESGVSGCAASASEPDTSGGRSARPMTGVMVDEYQDCTLLQHEIVLALADVVPTRLVGDPLQGLFSFRDNQSVDFDHACCSALRAPSRSHDSMALGRIEPRTR